MIDILPLFNDDALANQFQVVIPTFPNVLALDNTNFRITNISIPEVSVGTYNVEFQSRTYTKPNGKVTTPSEFSFTFRIDRYYSVYKGLVAWKELVMNSFTGVQSPDFIAGNSPTRIPVQVIAIDTANTVLATWSFTGCFPSTIGGFDFDHASGDPLTTTVTMQFASMQAPTA